MIVKVQASINTTASTQRVLVYNEDRSFLYEGGINEDMLETMKGRLKAYFEAEVTKTGLEIGDEVPPQDW